MLNSYFKSDDKKFYLLQGDCMELMPQFDHQFDMVFADPPYFLSNDGLSIQSGKIVSVNKGDWDKSHGFDYVNDFNRRWLTQVREKMKEDATIWISGTMHNIFSVGQILTELGFKILNVITWEKTNPPPNFSCRFFTYAAEQIIWARKSEKVPHYFNYELMKQLNGDKQMKDVWKLPAIAPWEKAFGKHPTQKPLSVLTRLILASTKPNAWILDPFAGSCTTGIAANLAGRRFLGMDTEKEFLDIGINRRKAIEHPKTAAEYRSKLHGFENKDQLSLYLANEPKAAAQLLLGYVKKKDFVKMEGKTSFYFHATDKQNNFIGFPYALYDAAKIVLYEGGRSKPFRITEFYAPIKAIHHKHKTAIDGKEKSKTEYYFEVELAEPFSLNDAIDTKVSFKKLAQQYKADFSLSQSNYSPIVIDERAVMV